MNFHDVSFPLAIAFQSAGGPVRRTEIVTLGSGHEERNAVWAGSRRQFDIGSGVRTLDDLSEVIAFFEARQGRLYAFRFRDFTDWKSCAPGGAPSPTDQAIATGDGVTASFPLVKTYASGVGSWTRPITRPVAGSVRAAVNGVETAVTVSDGIISFAAAPANGAAITAGYAFDCAVRFDSDALAVNQATFTAGEIPSIALVEVLS